MTAAEPAAGQTSGPAARPDPWFDVTAYGATGDGTTDDTAAIQAALTAAGSGTYPRIGGIVFMPRGTYLISQRLVVPFRVSLVGVGRDATTIKAATSFPADAELVRLGDLTGNIGEGCRIENLTVDCSGITGSTGIYSERINEQSGVSRCLVQDFGAKGIWINQPKDISTGAPQHWSIDDVEIFTGPATPASAVALAVTMTSLDMPIRQISSVTVFASTYTPLTTAIQLDGLGAGRVCDIHVEGCVTGILVGSVVSCWGTIFMNLDGMTNVTSLLVWSKAPPSPSASLIAIGVNGAGAKNALVDEINGNTLTFPVAYYAMGPGSVGNSTVFSTDFSLPTRLRRVQVLSDLRRGFYYPGYTASFTPDPQRGEMQQMVLTGNLAVADPVNPQAGQKLVFTWIQDGNGGHTISYGSRYVTGGAAAISSAPGTATIDQFICVDGTFWRLCGRVTGQ